VENIKATPSIAKFGFRVRNQWVEGARNNSTVNAYHGAGQEISRTKPFVLEASEPPVLLGKDTAANPVEHLLHALAACLTTSMVYHAAVLGILIEKVESFLEGDIDLHGFLELDQNVRQGYQEFAFISKSGPTYRTRNFRISANWAPNTRRSSTR
jgi:hypothetical protein